MIAEATHVESGHAWLQWVHGRITVVMDVDSCTVTTDPTGASMGPRSDNRGYVPALPGERWHHWHGFNGSTVG